MSANEARPGRRVVWLGVGAVAFVSVVVGIVAYVLRDARERQEQDRCERLTAQLNEAVGSLESGDFVKADAALSELARKFPNEPAAVRNLAICRVLAFLAPRKPGEPEASPEPAQSALDAARNLEPHSPVPHILAARMAHRPEDAATSINALEEAARLAPENAAIRYEIYQASQSTIEDVLRNKARAALAAAFKLAPTNSFLLKEELKAEVAEKDEAARETLKALLTQIEPIIPLVKQHARSDVNEFAGQLTEAIDGGKWSVAQGRAGVIGNVIMGEEWVRSDLRRLKPHSLAFVVLDFSSAVSGKPSAAAAGDDPRLPVQFRPPAAGGELPELPSVKALNLADVNLDGLTDIIAVTESELTVLSRTVADAAWEKMLAVPVRPPMKGLLVADLDRDVLSKIKPLAEPAKVERKADEAAAANSTCQAGDVEVVVYGPAGVQIFRNDLDDAGKRIFVTVEQSPDLEALRDVRAGVLADIDHDGDLDLILSTAAGISIWLNEGQLKFAEATKRSALPPLELAATSLVAVDWDRDLDTDILISGPNQEPAGWLENLRHGSMRWRKFEPDLDRLSGSASLNVLDIDGNVSWDLVGAGTAGLHLVRTRTDFPGEVKSIAFTQFSKEPWAGSLVGDFDNDTHPDLLAWGAAAVKLFWGTSAAQFTPADDVIQPPIAGAAACAAADMDGDGDLDLVIARSESLALYINEGGNKNHWLAVRAMGEAGDNQNTGDVNHLGIGSVLELRAGRKYQAEVVTGQVTHFGLGKKTSADVLRVIWTNGVPQPVVAPQADTNLCRVHAIGTSCPYFYTWNGSRFEFCTDACWAAPLGLQLAEGVFAEPRAWEYLTVSGDRLKPKDGKYLVQMTEELWEATYLDRMELIAVDHPAGVAIFSNEKVGPPELAEFKIHAVRDRRLPVAARDKHGRDVLAQIIHEDGEFMKGFDAAPRRGLTDEHFLELDLGAPQEPKKVTLFLTGWLFPASTSLRLGVSHDPSAPAPRPPALEVPDEHGNWQVVRPFMGFPGGRTKTIAVDLSDVFLTNDYRLRIVTNMEFYWDAAFFSVDEEPAPLELTRLPVVSADLHYRGYSAILRNPGFGPDGYDYNQVSTAPKWAPMAGRFTRYGDVTELLQEDDDLQVIFGSGDEITVAFDVPEKGPPPGWKRDFLLHNVGWDKDNDLNVVTSQAVEPLPFHGMSGYPYRADESYPDTPRHRDYLRKFQTREQFPSEFWRHVQHSARDK